MPDREEETLALLASRMGPFLTARLEKDVADRRRGGRGYDDLRQMVFEVLPHDATLKHHGHEKDYARLSPGTR